jgi:hypothetical protein
VIVRTLLQFQACESIDEIIVVTREDKLTEVADYCKRYGITKATKILQGGKERAESSAAGVFEADRHSEYIAISDGARPFVTPELISAAVDAARKYGAAAPAVPVKDTIKVAENGVVTDTPDTTGDFKLMTLTRESRYIGEGQGYTSVNDASYVCAIGSTDFASNAVLSSNAYGNTDLLLEILRVIGREIEPVGIKFKPMYSALAGQQYVVEAKPMNKLAVHVTIPALICAVSGIVVLVRRKFRK